jgi:predicted TIM-barrel enzyme
MNRGKIVEAWRRKRPITGGADGPDFIVVSNQDQLKMKGAAALLPLGDANALSLQSAKERVARAGSTPVIAGVCATDPLRLMDKFLQELKAAGVAGVQNAPSVGLIDGAFRTSLEEAKLGYAKEVDLVRLAAKLDLLTLALVFTVEEARAMAGAGAEAVVIHPGLGKKGAKSEDEIAAAAREARKDVLVLSYGAGGRALDGIQTE